MTEAVVFGGYGTFGGHVCRELAGFSVPVAVAGRDVERAAAFARTLGPNCRGLRADVTDPASCRAALAGRSVAVNCAGPFGRFNAALLDACLEAGCHYADIADDREYAARVRGHGPRFAEKGLAAVYGCSSLPGLSGALALKAREGDPAPPESARCTLFIGNHNPKGLAAVNSLLAGLRRPIPAPQGAIRGFADRAVVPLPPPFGHRGVFNFDSPEYDLFPALLGVKAVTVKVGFELRLANYAFALLAKVGSGYPAWLGRALDLPARAVGWFGHSGGAVMTELFYPGGRVRRAAVAAADHGQRMAALPCGLVVRDLAAGRVPTVGASAPYEFLGAANLLDGLATAGYTLYQSTDDRLPAEAGK